MPSSFKSIFFSFSTVIFFKYRPWQSKIVIRQSRKALNCQGEFHSRAYPQGLLQLIMPPHCLRGGLIWDLSKSGVDVILTPEFCILTIFFRINTFCFHIF